MEKVYDQTLWFILPAGCLLSLFDGRQWLVFIDRNLQKYWAREVPYNLRNGSVLFFHPPGLTSHGANSTHFRVILIWNQLPSSMKRIKSVTEFKSTLKQQGNIDYSCVTRRK